MKDDLTTAELKFGIQSAFIRLIEEIGVDEAIDFLDGLMHKTWEAQKEVLDSKMDDLVANRMRRDK